MKRKRYSVEQIVAAVTHCYLCGRPLSHPTTKDHCPPLTLFARQIRKQYNTSQLITKPVHKACNDSYHLDEQYFKATLVPLAPGSLAGDAIFKEFISVSRQDERKRVLAEKILREFEARPGGLHLPLGVVAKRQDGDRIVRVAWKIVRGLFFHHYNAILPGAFPIGCTLTALDRRPPEHFICVSGLADDETYGVYGGVFDYRFRIVDTDLGKLNYWAFLIWDRIIMTVYFHDPWSCQCEGCFSALAEMEMRASSPTS